MRDTYCKYCDSRFVNKRSYHGHLTLSHKVGWRQLQQKSPKDVIPDVNDPNFYCCSYQKTLANKNFFKAHLMQMHSIYYQLTLKKRSLHVHFMELSHSFILNPNATTNDKRSKLYYYTVHSACKELIKREISEGEGVIAVHRDRLTL